LHVLGQDELRDVLFPVGEYTKPEVRQLAEEMGLPVAQKSESQDLCFLGDGDYRRFLSEHAPRASAPGPILTLDGDTLGEHEGLPYYTIGQRKGLGVSAPEPVYVLAKDVTNNALVVGPRQQVGQTTFQVRQVNWISGRFPEMPLQARVKIRYKARELQASIEALEMGGLRVMLDQPAPGITPGQGAVFYQGDVCLGGGLIADRPQRQPLPFNSMEGVKQL
jgi:tRNA-specific 2-thiouridylase